MDDQATQVWGLLPEFSDIFANQYLDWVVSIVPLHILLIRQMQNLLKFI